MMKLERRDINKPKVTSTGEAEFPIAAPYSAASPLAHTSPYLQKRMQSRVLGCLGVGSQSASLILGKTLNLTTASSPATKHSCFRSFWLSKIP